MWNWPTLSSRHLSAPTAAVGKGNASMASASALTGTRALIAPFIANAKYMKAGMAPKQANEVLVPSLENAPELPPLQPAVPPLPLAHPPSPTAAIAQESSMAAPVVQSESLEQQKTYDADPFDV